MGPERYNLLTPGVPRYQSSGPLSPDSSKSISPHSTPRSGAPLPNNPRCLYVVIRGISELLIPLPTSVLICIDVSRRLPQHDAVLSSTSSPTQLGRTVPYNSGNSEVHRPSTAPLYGGGFISDIDARQPGIVLRSLEKHPNGGRATRNMWTCRGVGSGEVPASAWPPEGALGAALRTCA